MAKASSHIKSLDSLEKEIYRLRLEAKKAEEKLGANLDFLQHNYASMTMNSIFDRSSSGKEPGKEKLKEKLFDSIWENERVHHGINKIIGHLADKAAEGIESLIDRVLQKKD